MKEFKCVKCGRWHKDGSKVLNRHISIYFRAGGTINLDRWEMRTSTERIVSTVADEQGYPGPAGE